MLCGSAGFSQMRATQILRRCKASTMVKVMMGMKRTHPNPNRIRRARIETGMEI